MKERLHVEVEPFSEGKWARVERGVFTAVHAGPAAGPAPAEPRPWRRSVLASLAVVAAAALVLLLGRGWMGRGHSDLARIVTSDGASRFTFGESALEVDRDSVLLVRGDDERGVNLIVDRGRVTCEVAPRRGRPPFVVDAGEVRVRVVGTRFTVARVGETARVHVDHGAVEVTSRGVVSLLHDGESWPAALEEPVPLPSSTATVTIEPTAAPPAPEATTRPAPPPRTHRRHVAHEAPTPTPTPAPAPSTNVLPSPPAPPTGPAPPTPQARFELATRLERARPEEAETLYRQVAGTSSPWAANALFALARLKADHGEAADARRLVEQYLERYPGGTNAADARALRDRLR